jgi:hypothetical protein
MSMDNHDRITYWACALAAVALILILTFGA